jgi:putative endonuclease
MVRPPGGEPPGMSSISAWVYLLHCGDGSLYCGWTTDVGRRVVAHEQGRGSRYTRSRLPVVLAAALPMPDRTTARREEARIKRLSRGDKLRLVAAAASAEPGVPHPAGETVPGSTDAMPIGRGSTSRP